MDGLGKATNMLAKGCVSKGWNSKQPGVLGTDKQLNTVYGVGGVETSGSLSYFIGGLAFHAHHLPAVGASTCYLTFLNSGFLFHAIGGNDT